MRCPLCHKAKLAVLLVLLLALVAGCGSDSGGDPDPDPTCAISGVNMDGADSWHTGAQVNIRWTQNGVPGTVLIELLKGGAVVGTIAAAGANDGFHPWVVTTGGQANGSDFGVRVTGVGSPSCFAEVNNLTITDVTGCNFTFNSVPELISAGDSVTISWVSDHTSGTVDIELWTASFGNTLDDTVGTIAMDATDTGSYTWLVDSFHNVDLVTFPYDNYRYVIRDRQVPGCEAVSERFDLFDDEICSITVYGPSHGQVFAQGDTLQIQLLQDNGNGVVKLQLYAGNEFVTGGLIVADHAVIDDFFWIVNDYGFTTPSTAYNIRAFDAIDRYCTGESDRFTITP